MDPNVDEQELREFLAERKKELRKMWKSLQKMKKLSIDNTQAYDDLAEDYMNQTLDYMHARALLIDDSA